MIKKQGVKSYKRMDKKVIDNLHYYFSLYRYYIQTITYEYIIILWLNIEEIYKKYCAKEITHQHARFLILNKICKSFLCA